MTEMLYTEEELILKKTIRNFANSEIAPMVAENDRTEKFPYKAISDLATLGIYGIGIDENYGGVGGNSQQSSIVVEEIARVCAASSVTYVAHHSLAMYAIHHFGSEQQKEKFLPNMVNAKSLGAFCLTEPATGSDVAGIETTAYLKEKKYTVNGTKIFITNGSLAEIYVVFAKTYQEKGTKGINAFIIEKSSSNGIESHYMQGKMGLRASDTSQIFFTNVTVPKENLLGKDGDGFKIAMAVLDSSRISVAAQAVGIAQGALESALNYSKIRETFGQSISNFQSIQFMLADMSTKIDAARLMTRHASQLKDKGFQYTKEASEAKLFASECASYCADKAVQIHGGYGYFQPSYPERAYRDAKVTEIYEGTSEIQRLIIARQILKDT